MNPSEVVVEACRVAGVSQRELARRLGHSSASLVSRWCRGETGLGMEVFEGVLDALRLSGGWDGQRSWWVCRPEELQLPPAAGARKRKGAKPRAG